MPYSSNADLPAAVKNALPEAAQTIWRKAHDAALGQYNGDEEAAARVAWAAVKNKYRKEGDSWVAKEAEWTPIAKVDTDRHLVFGWASVAVAKDGNVVTDLHNDQIDADTLEDTAYIFNLEFGTEGLNDMHVGKSVGRLIESFVVTDEKIEKLAGDPADPDYADNLTSLQKALPRGWWTGFYVEDDETFAKVKNGDRRMFSIEGMAVREEL